VGTLTPPHPTNFSFPFSIFGLSHEQVLIRQGIEAN
jgi:hypothetical protein